VSQFTKHARSDAHATPRPARPRRIQKGARESDIPTGHCFAALRSAPSRGRKRHALRRPGRAQRWPVWLFGCLDVRLSTPCWLRLRRGGCGVSMGALAPMPRELTRRGCPSGAAQQQSEFHGAPRNRHDEGLPLRTAKGSQTGGRLSFGYFSLAKQRTSTSAAGPRPGFRTETKHAVQTRTPRLRRARLKQQEANSITIKTIAASA
jgi:hypothetical protein